MKNILGFAVVLEKWLREAEVWRGLRGAWWVWVLCAAGWEGGAGAWERSPLGPVGALGMPGPGREDGAVDEPGPGGAVVLVLFCWEASSREAVVSPVSASVA